MSCWSSVGGEHLHFASQLGRVIQVRELLVPRGRAQRALARRALVIQDQQQAVHQGVHLLLHGVVRLVHVGRICENEEGVGGGRESRERGVALTGNVGEATVDVLLRSAGPTAEELLGALRNEVEDLVLVLVVSPLQFDASKGLVDDREEEVDENEADEDHVEEEEEQSHVPSAFHELREVELVCKERGEGLEAAERDRRRQKGIGGRRKGLEDGERDWRREKGTGGGREGLEDGESTH